MSLSGLEQLIDSLVSKETKYKTLVSRRTDQLERTRGEAKALGIRREGGEHEGEGAEREGEDLSLEKLGELERKIAHRKVTAAEQVVQLLAEAEALWARLRSPPDVIATGRQVAQLAAVDALIGLEVEVIRRRAEVIVP
jgi:DNA-binding response OmpR family regulator